MGKNIKFTTDALSAKRGTCTWHGSLAILRNVEAAGFAAEEFMPVYEVTRDDILGREREVRPTCPIEDASEPRRPLAGKPPRFSIRDLVGGGKTLVVATDQGSAAMGATHLLAWSKMRCIPLYDIHHRISNDTASAIKALAAVDHLFARVINGADKAAKWLSGPYKTGANRRKMKDSWDALLSDTRAYKTVEDMFMDQVLGDASRAGRPHQPNDGVAFRSEVARAIGHKQFFGEGRWMRKAMAITLTGESFSALAAIALVRGYETGAIENIERKQSKQRDDDAEKTYMESCLKYYLGETMDDVLSGGGNKFLARIFADILNPHVKEQQAFALLEGKQLWDHVSVEAGRRPRSDPGITSFFPRTVAEDIEKNGSEFRQGAATWQAVAADLATGRWWVSPFHSFAMLLDIEEEGAHAWGLHPASDPAPHLRVRAAIAIAVNIASVRFRSNLRFMAPGPWRLARYTTKRPAVGG